LRGSCSPWANDNDWIIGALKAFEQGLYFGGICSGFDWIGISGKCIEKMMEQKVMFFLNVKEMNRLVLLKNLLQFFTGYGFAVKGAMGAESYGEHGEHKR